MIVIPSVYLGIDIGGTSTKYALVDSCGNIYQRNSFNTGMSISKKVFLERLLSVSNEGILQGASGIGICSLGVVNADTGEILGAAENLPFLEGVNLRKELQKTLPKFPVYVCNDVHAVAKGERWLGAAKNVKNYFCMALGTGLGGALVIDSKLVEGSHYRAGEIGYLDYYGEHDYIEKYVSTSAVMKLASDKLGEENIDGFRFFELIREGNIICNNILDKWTEKLSRIIANLIITLDLELILISGGVSNEKEILIPIIVSKVDYMLPSSFRGQTRICAAAFGNDAGILGAVSDFFV